jgi:hypothetical protein
MHYFIDWLKTCRHILQHPAHKAERPVHVIYFLLVAYYSGGPYGVAAVGCAIITLLGSGDDTPSAT